MTENYDLEEWTIAEQFTTFRVKLSALPVAAFTCWRLSLVFTSSSTRMTVGRLLPGYLCPLVETPMGHLVAVEGLGGLHGEFVHLAQMPSPIYSANERKHLDVHVHSPRHRNVMMLIVRNIIGAKEVVTEAARQKKKVTLLSVPRARGGPEVRRRSVIDWRIYLHDCTRESSTVNSKLINVS